MKVYLGDNITAAIINGENLVLEYDDAVPMSDTIVMGKISIDRLFTVIESMKKENEKE